MPEKAQSVAQHTGDKPLTLRDKIVQATPAFIINSSSHVIGLMHIAAETLMLKASGVVFLRNMRGAQSRECLKAIERLEKERKALFQSTDEAAKAVGFNRIAQEMADIEKQLRIGSNPLIDPPNNLWRGLSGADKDQFQQNHWSTRATMSGFSAWVLGSILPDREKPKADKKSDEQLYDDSKTQYAGRRLWQAIQIGNTDTKRQQIGLGVTAAGLFSAVSGFNNINLKTGIRFTNWPHAIGGLITALSGANLLFAKTDREGWKGFGSTLWLRLPLAGFGTYKKYINHDRWTYYGAGQVLFQSAGVYAYLFGGLKKLPDGTIVETKNPHGGGSEVAEAALPSQKGAEAITQGGKALLSDLGKEEQPAQLSLIPETKVASSSVESASRLEAPAVEKQIAG